MNIILQNAIDCITKAAAREQAVEMMIKNHDVYAAEKRIGDLNREINRLRICLNNSEHIRIGLEKKLKKQLENSSKKSSLKNKKIVKKK